MKFGQNVPRLSMQKRVQGFFDIPNTSPFEHFHVTKIGKYSIRQLQIDFLVNQSEYQKSLTIFCSLSATD